MNVSDFLEKHYRHFNARETVAAAKAYREFIDAKNGRMMVTLAGAMSTGELGLSLAEMIREGKVHAVTCTAANLEEDIFNLVAHDEYRVIEDWRALSADDEEKLLDEGFNRVTDTCIPETVMRHIEKRLLNLWKRAADEGKPRTPAEFMFELLDDPELPQHFQVPRENSWLAAAKDAGIPVYVPGVEDSTMGNIFTARVIDGSLPSHAAMTHGTVQLQRLSEWYRETSENHPIGFFQIGGGIAGDFPICVVPMMRQDLRLDIPLWSYFCQISDAQPSYGGYSGAVPNEKITWEKLSRDTPKFMVQSDATIVVPLIFAYVLGW
ncbi:deoxyhypusine synthase family protein [Stieleria sp. JC731]|uniref:deoxyhypusine synthase family protein n=1 Tax=Pirellulaceae TaxID=2691357 RepID=UPI001E56C173|nr:deoxyhypusine synthase family protein [Stieleria sp. JC731]MCC9600398.1 deoxyhypusine synthase family protein [Stieleria sp. JC731]